MDPTRAMSQYVHDHFGPEQGFPRGPVYAITQTADGYLWIATQAGLVRFDGLNFVAVTDPSREFEIRNVLGLAADPDGSLWLRLQGTALLRYRNGAFELGPNTLTHAGITAMSRTGEGDLLIAESGAVFGGRSGRFALLEARNSLPRSPILSLTKTHAGELWMGTRDAGLVRASGGETGAVGTQLPHAKINCLLPDGEHGLWIGTDDGIARWNGSQFISTGVPANANSFQALAMVRDRDGNLWVGTDSRGLLRVNADGMSSLPGSGQGEGEAITAIFEDREGNLWMGSADGIDRLRDSPFVTYSGPEGLPTDGSNPVYVDEENRLWFPPIAGGLWWAKGVNHGQLRQAGLEHDVVYSMAGREGELWVARQRGGLTQVTWQGGSNIFAAKTYTHAMGLAQDSVYSVYESRDGTVWAGTLSAGASRLENGAFTTYTIDQGLASNTVAAILETSDGTVWFATPNGLSALTKDRWVSYSTRDGLPSENINCLFEDSAGVLWVGTSAGLAFRVSRHFQGIAAVPEPLRDQIFGIAEGRFGGLWISTASRILRIDRGKLMLGFLAEGDIREFGVADGLRGTEGVKRQPSVVADQSGRIWFSLNRGISVVDPARLDRSEVAAPAQIQSVSADNVSMAMGAWIRVPAGRQRVVFSFAGLDLSVPERVRYRFRLDGFDRDWNGPVERREAVYTNLGPGQYRFHVMASNIAGLWDGNEATVGLEIAPAFWQTWWFRTAVLLAAGLMVLGLYRLRLRELTKQLHVRFEERLGERTRIAQELHDTLLQGFLSASMQLHVAVERLPDGSPARSSLSRVQQLMTQVIEEGRNAVRGLRSSESSAVNLEQAFARIQNELGIGDDIAFRVVVMGEPRALNPLLRDEVYRIGREALVNAFRHSKGRDVEMEIDYAPSQLRVSVRDDGRGIDAHVLESGKDGHWGLTGMRERAEKMGGKLRVWSRAASGTEVQLSVPGHLAFPSQPSGGVRRWIAKLHFTESAAARIASKAEGRESEKKR